MRMLASLPFTLCSLTGICLSIKTGGFWWAVANFIPPVGLIHGFGYWAGFWAS